MPGLALTINDAVVLDGITEDTRVLSGALESDELKLALGGALKESLRNHFFDLAGDAEHHESASSLGANRSGFYLEAADKTQDPQLQSEGVSVSVAQEGLAQRYFGGDIEGDPFLTVPARGEAYGHRASDFDFLKLVVFPSGLGALVDKNAPAHEGDVYFWLVRHVHQEPDETVLPKNEEMLAAILEQGSGYIEDVWSRRAA